MAIAEGQEVLVIDCDPKVQRGLEHLLRSAGLTPTVVGEVPRALELATEKFFAVALVDLDTPVADGGLETLGKLHRISPATALLTLAPRRSFEAAVRAFRSGADDVIVKVPEQVDYLRGRVVELAGGKQRAREDERLIEQTLAHHEELMKVLIDTHRRILELEEKRAGGSGDEGHTTLLLVGDDGWLEGQLRVLLDERGGFELRSVATGGEALDLVGRDRYHIALVRDTLPDLPGNMVLRSIKAQSPDAIVLSYASPAGQKAGWVQLNDGQRVIPFLPAFTDPRQLVDRIGELREAFHAAARERRHLGSFRQQHFELLKRYAELRQKLQRAAEATSSPQLKPR